MKLSSIIIRMIAVIGFANTLYSTAAAQFGTEMVYYELNKLQGNLAPLELDDMRTIRMDEIMFDALYGYNERADPEPQMAQGMPTLLDDSTSALVILKSNLYWPDSIPITVNDVIFTFNLKKIIPGLKDSRYALEFIKDIKPGEAPNSIIFKFTRKIQYPERLLVNLFILPKHKLIDPKAFNKYAEIPMGSGSFQLKDISIASNSYNLYKNQYYGYVAPGRPYFDRIKMVYWGSKTIWSLSILNGVVQILPDMEYNTVLSNTPQIRSIPISTNSIPMLLFNMRDPILKNTFVRQGMQYLISRSQIVSTIYMQDSSTVLTGPYPLTSYFCNYSIPAWDLNLEKADSLFEKSGLLTLRDGKLIRKDTGKQWDLNLITYIVPAGEEGNLHTALEAIVTKYLPSAGINSSIEYKSSEGHLRALQSGNFQLIYVKITLNDPYNIEPFFSTDAITRPGGQNYGRYSNLAVDKAFKDMLSTPFPQKQIALGLTIHKILHDDPPAMFLWNLYSYAYCRSELQNVTIHPFYFFSTVDRWSKKVE